MVGKQSRKKDEEEATGQEAKETDDQMKEETREGKTRSIPIVPLLFFGAPFIS